MELYERYGRSQAAYFDLLDVLRETIDLLVRLQAGQVALEDIDVQPNGWKMKDKNAPPE